jgi:HEAT repeat protein
MSRREATLMLAFLFGAAACARVKDERAPAGSPAPTGSPTPAGSPAPDAVELSYGVGGLTSGSVSVRWDPARSRMAYESTERARAKAGEIEAWERQPSAEEWDRFWKAMDAADVWRLKASYETEIVLDCGHWRLFLRHGTRSVGAQGCSEFPATWQAVAAEVERLAEGPEEARAQAVALAKTLDERRDAKSRIEAAHALAALGPAAEGAVPALVRALGDRAIAAGSNHAGRAADARSRVPRDGLADAAAQALAAMGTKAVPALVEALKDEDPIRRRRAAAVLGQIGGRARSAVPALTESLKDPAVRQAAARALPRIDIGTDNTVALVLVEGVDDPDPETARLAAAALEDLGDVGVRALLRVRSVAAVPILIRALGSPDAGKRRDAAFGLGVFGSRASEAVQALIEVLRSDPDSMVRDAAAGALGETGRNASSTTVPALIESFRYGGSAYGGSGMAMSALTEIGRPAIPALLAALKCDHLPPGTPPSPSTYRGSTDSEIENVRVQAAQTLWRIAGRDRRLATADVISAFTEALRDEHPRVRQSAELALRQLRPR